MKLGRKLGEGGNSEVFEWGDKVIKLAKPNTDLTDLQREFHNTLTVWRMGVPVPQPFEMLEVKHRPGIVFERVDGESITERLFNAATSSAQPEFDWNGVRMTARLLSELHQLSTDDIRPQRDFLKRQIRSVVHLQEDEKEDIIRLLDQLPEKNQICHGDPNPNNIMISNGDPIVIDWNDATCGNPESDVAEYIVIIKFAILPPETPQVIVKAFDSMRAKIIEVFMEEYTLFTGTTYEEIEPWIVPIAARKLTADAISDEEKQLLVKEIRKRLELLNVN
ncbi:phosphotransferase [Sporosarcina sp. ACRSL]|uniref:aminoglycoside phosphotransferase family protein n=1 Tax=Sporosarcina sp. ACRSL TaxID=2918215 RepID=UPI001EF42924|nr:aminoglycoside phosphotransferase family protein [Sporosarcina sp. ACRSL]MCG7346006.1 phosphotransferase [Sporosarcina sp. ACRSL]